MLWETTTYAPTPPLQAKMNQATLIEALAQDHAARNIHFDLEMAWYHRGLAHPPPPPALQRAPRYVFDIHKEAASFSREVQAHPRLLIAIHEQIATASLPHEAKSCIQFLIAFFVKTSTEHWLAIPTEQMDVAVIFLLRCITRSSVFHAAIRQLILSRSILRTYAEQRVEIYRDCIAYPEESHRQLSYITGPFRDVVPPPEFATDLQLAIATTTISAYMEDDIYRRLRKSVHLGRKLVARAPLLTAYYRVATGRAAPHIEWLAWMLEYADTLEEVADAAAAAGIEVGPSPPGR